MNERIRKRILSILPPDYDTKGNSVPGIKLRKAGFTFFDPRRNYCFGKPERDGLVRVFSLCDHLDQDEDDLGEECVYDWWYLTEELQEVPGAGYLRACTRSEIRDRKLKEYRDRVADMKWLNEYRYGISINQHAVRRIEQYGTVARAEIAEELEHRKHEEGTTFRTGEALRGQGHAFFNPDRDYFLKPLPEKGLVEVSAFNRYDEALLDFDGRTNNTCYFDWWYLDGKLEPIPGFARPLDGSMFDRAVFKHRYEVLQTAASQALEVSKAQKLLGKKPPRSTMTGAEAGEDPGETGAPFGECIFRRLFFGRSKR